MGERERESTGDEADSCKEKRLDGLLWAAFCQASAGDPKNKPLSSSPEAVKASAVTCCQDNTHPLRYATDVFVLPQTVRRDECGPLHHSIVRPLEDHLRKRGRLLMDQYSGLRHIGTIR